MTNTLLAIENLEKIYNQKSILKDINFTIEKGSFVSIVGPSGCGKTTLLRILIGLELADSGNILKNNEKINNSLPSERKFSIVFQDYALFPHMTLYDNIAYGLKLKKIDKELIRKKVEEVAQKLGLTEHLIKYPSQLSGGQQQRVAIARALVLDSEVILLDEPFSALDAQVRLNLQEELKGLQREFGITMIMVTHDQEEALTLSDQVIVMNEGRIEKIGTPHEVYNETDNEFIKSFIGEQVNKKYGQMKKIIG